MADPQDRSERILDLTQMRDARYKDAGIHVNRHNRARCTARLCDWLTAANSRYGGTSPFPYGFLLARGEREELREVPESLGNGPFLELLPCDRPDPRAVRLAWNPSGTEATFGFALMAAALAIDKPNDATLWIEAIPASDMAEKPVMLLPLGGRIQIGHVREAAPDEPGKAE